MTHDDVSDAADRLGAEISAGRELDRRLADGLGRPAPPHAGASASFWDELDRRAAPVAARERELVARAQAGDVDARAALIEASMPMISQLARTYRSGRVHRQELLQEGAVGVLRALERFDPTRGVPFGGYAAWWVRHAMQQLVAELTRPVVLSDRALRNLSRLKQAQEEAVAATGRNPDAAELARRAGLDAEAVADLLAVERSPRSIDQPAPGEADGRELGTFGDLLVDPLAEDAYEAALGAIEARELHDLLAGLSERERDVLRARYGLDGDEQSLRDIGARLGISAERVRQIEQRALTKLAARW